MPTPDLAPLMHHVVETTGGLIPFLGDGAAQMHDNTWLQPILDIIASQVGSVALLLIGIVYLVRREARFEVKLDAERQTHAAAIKEERESFERGDKERWDIIRQMNDANNRAQKEQREDALKAVRELVQSAQEDRREIVDSLKTLTLETRSMSTEVRGMAGVIEKCGGRP